MPDESTSGSGDSGPSNPSFRGGVERAGDRADEPAPSLMDRLRDTIRPTDDEPPTSATDPVPSRTATTTGPAIGADPAGDRVEDDRPRRSPSNGRQGRVRARKVRRIVRHIEPWSVLKISLLFYAALFVIISVASTLLWNAARNAGTVDDIESFITEVGGFGTCEPIDGEGGTATTTTTVPPDDTTPPDQLDPTGTETTVAPGELPTDPEEELGDEQDCREGEVLVGEFQFEDGKIFQAFILGGIVLVLAGSAMNVVLALLFNLMSDLTGGVRVTVLEEDAPRPGGAGSPRTRGRG